MAPEATHVESGRPDQTEASLVSQQRSAALSIEQQIPVSSRDAASGPEPTPLDAIESPEERRIVESMRRVTPGADPVARLPDVPPSRVPRHIAIIMDGNGRWARQRGFARMMGHRAGAGSVRTTLEECARLGVEFLTLYSFSMENWKRPQDEVGQLMSLYLEYMGGEREELVRRNVQFRQIGRRDGMPESTLRALDSTLEATAGCTGITLCLAVNYGARAEITDAVREIARSVADGSVSPDEIDESLVAGHLYTDGMPDPDLLIRTAGEMRISNYLLWQISYSELVVTDVLWPDFGVETLHDAIRTYASRERRFGGLGDASGDGE